MVLLAALPAGDRRDVGTIGETLVDKVTPGARDVACHLAVTSATGLQSELDTLLRS